MVKLTNAEKVKYKKYGVNVNSKYFPSLYKQGLLSLEQIDDAYIQEIQSYYKKHFKYEIDPRDHIVFYNVTGKKDVRILPTSVLRGGAKGGYLIQYFNDRGMVNAYNDKSLYDNIFKDFNRAYNVIKRVRGQYMTRDFQGLTTEEALQILLTDRSEYIVKQSDTDDGKTIAKLKVREGHLYLKDKKVTLHDLERIYGHNFLVQRVIQQHPVMGKLHPSSVNTLRIVTLRWNGEIHYVYAFTRFGVNYDVKDNAGSGGLVVGVKDNGEFMPYGIYKNEKVSHHPTTKEPIAQLQEVPNFEACKEKVKKMHERIIHHDFVSWDIAVTEEEEPIFIEVNFFGTALLNQLALERPLFGDLTAEVLEQASTSFKKLEKINTKNFYSKLNQRFRKRNREYRELVAQNKQLQEELNDQLKAIGDYFITKNNRQGSIGMLRYVDEPNKQVALAAKRANELNYDFIFFHPKDVDITTQQINGLLYQEGEWIRVRTHYPNVVDNPNSRRAYRDVLNDLKKHTIFTTHRVGNKDVVFNSLLKEPTFSSMIIPYESLQSLDQVFSAIEQYEKVIIKPTNQRNGRNIHFMMQYDEKYIYHDGHAGYLVDAETLSEIAQSLMKKNMMIQRFIPSMTNEGRPFDLRIHVKRNGTGHWEVVQQYARVGDLGSPFSTTNATVLKEQSLKDFLDTYYEPRASQDILVELESFISTFPNTLQKHYTQMLSTLNIDLGLDENGKLWLFEVGTIVDADERDDYSYVLAVDYAIYSSSR